MSGSITRNEKIAWTVEFIAQTLFRSPENVLLASATEEDADDIIRRVAKRLKELQEGGK